MNLRPCVLGLTASGEDELRQVAKAAFDELSDSVTASTPQTCDDLRDGPARLVVTGASGDEIANGLEAFVYGRPSPMARAHVRRSDPSIAFIFAGQSETRAGMGMDLYRESPRFASIVDRCSAIMGTVPGGSLVLALYDSRDPSLLDDARLAQPALFALQGGLVALWSEWGVTPDAVAGHSLGEYAAAYAAGVMTIDDGIKLVATRGRLTQSLDPIGAMAVLFATEEWVNAAIAGHENDMSIAAINAPEVIVVSGHNEHIVELLRVAETHKVSGKMLKISHAFHSPCIEPMLTELEEAAAKIPLNEPTVRFASTLEGRLLDPGEVPDASYWRRHAREPVRFLSTMRELKRAGCNVFLELGPHATLTGLGERCVSPEVAQWLPSLRRKGRDWQVIVETAIKLWLAGVELNLAGMAKSLGWEWVGSRDGSVQRRAEGRKRK